MSFPSPKRTKSITGSNAECTTYTSGTPSSTFCLLDVGESVCERTQDCKSQRCRTGSSPKICVQCFQDSECASTEYCRQSDGTCKAKAATGASCAGGVPCLDSTNATCTTYATGSGGGAGDYCLLADGKTCTTGNGKCVSNYCHTDGICTTPTQTGNTCTQGISVCISPATCTGYATGSGGDAGDHCLLATTATCTANGQCVSNGCKTGATRTCGECATNATCISLYSGAKSFCVGNTCNNICAITALTSPATFNFPNGIAIHGDYVWVNNTRGANQYDAPWVTKLNRADGTLAAENRTGWAREQYLQGISVGTDGVPLTVDYTSASGNPQPTDPPLPAIFKVNADASRGDVWYTFPNRVNDRPYGIFIDGTATNGTVWVTHDSRKLNKFTVAAGVVTLADTFTGVCSSGNARQVAKSGRAGDDYIYVACQGDNAVSVIDPTTGSKVTSITGAPNVLGLAFNGATNTMFTSNANAGKVRTWTLSGVGASVTATGGCESPALATPAFMSQIAPNGNATQAWASMFDAKKVVMVEFQTP